MSESEGPELRTLSFPAYRHTVDAMIRHAATTWDGRELVVLDQERLTYADAEERSAEFAQGLLATGNGKGTRIGLLAPNGPDWVVAWLAISRIGAVAVLFSTYAKARELGRDLRLADVACLLTVGDHLGNDYVARLEQAVPGLEGSTPGAIRCTGHPSLRTVHVWSDRVPGWATPVGTGIVDRAGEAPDVALAIAEAEVDPADPAVVIFTSGSTTDPKAVVHTQGTVVRHPHNLGQFRDLGPDSRMYTPMPLFWVGGLAYTLVAAIHAGATVVFEERFEPGTTLRLLERERITHLTGWPHMGKALAEHPDYPSTDLSSIRSSGLSDLLPAGLRPADPELRANSLGMTETFGPHSIEDRSVDWPESKRGTYGRAVPGVEHRIVDLMTGEDLPSGEMGEVWVRGYSLMAGLLGVDRSEAFTADGWLRTGDGGWLDEDGHLFFRGRLGEVIKSSGTNVTPREVELALEDLPEVMHAFVLGIPHPDRGEDVAAALVLRPGVEAGPDELRAAVKEVLSTYKVPRHLALFATPRDLPWLESGKIDRRAVQRLLVEEFADR